MEYSPLAFLVLLRAYAPDVTVEWLYTVGALLVVDLAASQLLRFAILVRSSDSLGLLARPEFTMYDDLLKYFQRTT